MENNLKLIAVAIICMSASPVFAVSDVPVPREKPTVPVPREQPAMPQTVAHAKPEPATSEPDQGSPVVEIRPMQVRPVYDAEQFDKCARALRDRNVDFEELPAQTAKPPCGVTRPLRVTALSNGVEVTGKPTLNCATVLALDTWATSGVQTAANNHLEAGLQAISISTSYQCRRRNNASNGKFSEHAFGNGIDVMSFTTGDGVLFPVQPYDGNGFPAAEFQAKARSSACKYFTTVLGPGSNAAHANHFHLDLAIRRGGYRLCE